MQEKEGMEQILGKSTSKTSVLPNKITASKTDIFD